MTIDKDTFAGKTILELGAGTGAYIQWEEIGQRLGRQRRVERQTRPTVPLPSYLRWVLILMLKLHISVLRRGLPRPRHPRASS